jgi:hypothetical protein
MRPSLGVAVFAMMLASALHAQSASPASAACSYDSCALRVEGEQILRGSGSTEVGRFGVWRATALVPLVIQSDSAQYTRDSSTATIRPVLAGQCSAPSRSALPSSSTSIGITMRASVGPQMTGGGRAGLQCRWELVCMASADCESPVKDLRVPSGGTIGSSSVKR